MGSGVGVGDVVGVAVAVGSAVASSASAWPEACSAGAAGAQAAGPTADRMTSTAIAMANKVSCSTVWRFCVIIPYPFGVAALPRLLAARIIGALGALSKGHRGNGGVCDLGVIFRHSERRPRSRHTLSFLRRKPEKRLVGNAVPRIAAARAFGKDPAVSRRRPGSSGGRTRSYRFRCPRQSAAPPRRISPYRQR